MAAAAGLIGPGEAWAAVTPDDDADLPAGRPRALYVGGAGAVVVMDALGTEATFAAVPAGALLPIRPARVKATDTTATAIVAVY